MKVSDKTIVFLGKTICGDNGLMPYKSGPQLVDYFYEFGSDDVYDGNFPTRWVYTEGKVSSYNNTNELKNIIEKAVDVREFVNTEFTVEGVVKKLNKFLSFDDYELKVVKGTYKVYSQKGFLVETDSVSSLSCEYIEDNLVKCKSKIKQGDFKGAITNARTLVEAVMIEIVEIKTGERIDGAGKIEKLYKNMKKVMTFPDYSTDMDKTVKQVLSGLESISQGLAGISNKSADRHANKFNTQKHHAKLAVNSSFTFVEFLIDSLEYQSTKKTP